MILSRSNLLWRLLIGALVLALGIGSQALFAQDDATPTPTLRHGHHTPSPTPKSTSDSSSSDSEDGPDFDGVQFVDKKLNGLIKVEKVNSELSPSKLLTIYVDLRNKTRKPLEIQVQTVFADVAKAPLSTEESWVDLPLKPRESTEYCSEALSESARSYLVKIRLEPTDPNDNSGPGTDQSQIPATTPSPTPTAAGSEGDNGLTNTPPPMDLTGTHIPTPAPQTGEPTPSPMASHMPTRTPHPKPHYTDSATLP